MFFLNFTIDLVKKLFCLQTQNFPTGNSYRSSGFLETAFVYSQLDNCCELWYAFSKIVQIAYIP